MSTKIIGLGGPLVLTSPNLGVGAHGTFGGAYSEQGKRVDGCLLSKPVVRWPKGWNIHSEAHPVGGDSGSTTDPYPDEHAAREAFGAMRHDVKYSGTRVRWLIQLRHGAEIVDEFGSPV